jgi:LysM repeat protein
MAKDATAPNTVSAKPSKTSPQYARSLRNIMLLERILEERNKRYQRDMKTFLAEKIRLHPDLKGKDKQGLEEHFTKNFYGPEYSAMAEFSKLDEKRLPLLEKEAELAKKGKTLSKPESEKLAVLNMQVELGPEAYATQRLFDADTVKKLKREYPEIEKNLSDEIKEISKNGFDNFNPATRHMPATVALFNKKYPGLESELSAMKASPDQQKSMLGACAMGMLKTGSVMLNPTGFFVSKAVAGILKTKTLAPLRENAAIGISRVVNKTGLGDWFKRQCSKLPKDTLKNVAIGASVATSVALVGLGVVELEDAYKIKDSALAFVESVDFAPVTEGFNEAIDSTRDYFSQPEQVTATPDPTKEGSFLDGVSNTLGNALDSASKTVDETLSSAKDYFSPPEDISADPDPSKNSSLIDSLAAEPESSESPKGPEVGAGSAPSPEVDSGAKVEQSAPESNLSQEAPIEAPSPEKPNEGVSATAQEPNSPTQEKPAEAENQVNQEPKTSLESEGELFPNSYTVEPGDTLSEIVEERLQAAGVPYNYSLINDYVELVSANSKIADPDIIMAGQEIDLSTLPSPSEVMSPEQLEEAKNGIDSDPTMKNYSPELREAIGGEKLNNEGPMTINYQPDQYIAPHLDTQSDGSHSPRRMA